MFSRLSILSRLVLSILFFIGVIGTSIYFFAQAVNDNISFAEQEKLGNQFQRPFVNMLSILIDHQTNNHEDINSNKAKSEEINKLFAELKNTPQLTMDALKLNDEGLKNRAKENLRIDLIEAKWRKLENTTKYGPKEKEAYSSLIDDIKGFISLSGDTSNLILDPDLDSYYLMDAVVLALPQTIDRLGTFVNYTIDLLGRNEKLSQEEKIQLAVYERFLKEADMDRILTDIDTAFKEDKNFNGVSPTMVGLTQPLEEYKKANSKLLELTAAIIDDKSVSKAEFLSASTKSREAVLKFWDVSNTELTSLLNIRIKIFEDKKIKVIISNMAALIFSIIAFFVVVMSITGPFKKIRELMVNLSNNNTEITIPYTKQKNEIGDMSRALSVLRDAVCQNLLMQKMTSEYPVMKLSQDLKINFLNNAALQALTKLGFKESDVIDKGIAIISPVLASLGDKYKTEHHFIERIQINSEYVDFKINRLEDEKGGFDGVYINPIIVTEIAQNETAIALAQSEIQTLVNEAYKGNLSKRIDDKKFTGFYKSLASSMNGLMDAINEPINASINAIKSLSAGDLTYKVNTQFEGIFGEIQNALNDTINNLNNMVGEITISTGSVTNAANEIAAGTRDLAHRTENQASSIEQTTISMQQVNDSVNKNSQEAQEARNISDKTKNIAITGGEAVNQTIEAIKSIEASSIKIVNIIDVIDEIAFQTNLLALNAAVEAARAGEAGKGFAVVAQEVRSLAARSATASKEIKDLITDSVEKVKNGVVVAQKSGNDLQGIMSSITKLADLVGNIANATLNQSREIAEITKTIGAMDDMTQQNAALVEENSAATESMKEQTHNLQELINYFKVSVSSSSSSTNAEKPAVSSKKSVASNKVVAASGQNNTEWEEF